MAEPLVAATPAPPVPLTRRASLNGIAFALDLGVKTGVSLVLTPLLVDRLGAGLFGVWEMLGRLAGYPAAIGGPPGGAPGGGGAEPPAPPPRGSPPAPGARPRRRVV